MGTTIGNLPTNWNGTRESTFVRLPGGNPEPAYAPGVPRIGIDTRYTRGGRILVRYGIPGTYNPGGYTIKKLSGNYATFQKGSSYTFLELRYYVEWGGGASDPKTLWTPSALAPGTTIPTGWDPPLAEGTLVYDPASPPGLATNEGRAAIDAYVIAGPVMRVKLGDGNLAGGDLASTSESKLALDWDADDNTLEIVYRIYRGTIPQVSVSIITPGGDPSP
jgi:hypothetical protein